MSGLEIVLLSAFFLVVLGGTATAGYAFIVSPAQEGRDLLEGWGAASLPRLGRVVVHWFRLLGESLPSSGKRVDPARRRLTAAGYRFPAALSIYSGVSYASAAFFCLLGAWSAFLYQGGWFPVMLAAMAAAGFGYLLPDRILDYLVRQRVGRIHEALPVALDLLVLGIEAGQTLDVALTESSRELRFAHPDLARELTTVAIELRSATRREQVFRDLGTRNADPDLRKVASLFIDSDRFGNSLGPALRTHARYLRVRRRQVAQEQARKIGIKLIFPVFFLIFPCVLLVSVGPALLQVMTSLRSMGR